MCEAASESSGDSGRDDDESAQGSSQVTVRVCLRIFPVSLTDIAVTYAIALIYFMSTLLL
jgi:hypothetical protein